MLIYSSDASGDLTAEAPGTLAAPQIVGQPVDQQVGAGDFASFSVVVANTSGVTFQWAFNGTDIAGANGDSVLLPAVSAADVGPYSVTVTNSAGSVTSSVAALALDSGVSTASSLTYFIGQFSSAEDSLLRFRAVSDEWILAELQAGRFAQRVVGNTAAGFGNVNDGRPSWIGDFTGAALSQVLFYSPSDDNWWLASLDATGKLQFSVIGNTAAEFGHGINDGRPFLIGDFTGAGHSQVLLYDPSDSNWWLGSVDATGKLQWSLAENFGVLAEGNTTLADIPFWVGDFTGAGHSQGLFYYPPVPNWYLGPVDATGKLQWSQIGNPAALGNPNDGRPSWVGDFTGAGSSQVLLYSPSDFNWWLASVAGADAEHLGELQLSLVDNWAGFGQNINDGRPFWIGDLTGAGSSQVLFHSPSADNWWLGSVDAAGKLQWSLIDNTAG